MKTVVCLLLLVIAYLGYRLETQEPVIKMVREPVEVTPPTPPTPYTSKSLLSFEPDHITHFSVDDLGK